MHRKHLKTLEIIFSNPVNGNLEWSRIEALFIAIGCNVLEGNGSGVMFEKDGAREYFHRPHPDKAALRYRVKAAKEFLVRLGYKG
ncbi:MAG: type II toxin-antitoxin system HicA family toxin [Desulfuromonadaceae bacterium]|nr:type II toxin-antitoxin system HicA family toxin [Desulfuromonas sp.]MDY0184857.1 type II toxin-antitoxin system HicA family toxin [Desulfuromonadaceae bacterium]